MNLTFVQTNDNSPTLYNAELNEHYHSIHGARQESVHVYIKSALEIKKETGSLRVFEMGFGTGLNVLLSVLFSEVNQLKIDLTSIEKFPLPQEIYKKIAFSDDVEENVLLQKLHEFKWEETVQVSPLFSLTKKEVSLHEFETESGFDVIFYDAFGPDKQPDLWTLSVFEKLLSLLNPEGILVTYSAKGQVRRDMQSAGFRVERIPGPPGKREMLRGIKP